MVNPFWDASFGLVGQTFLIMINETIVKESLSPGLYYFLSVTFSLVLHIQGLVVGRGTGILTVRKKIIIITTENGTKANLCFTL